MYETPGYFEDESRTKNQNNSTQCGVLNNTTSDPDVTQCVLSPLNPMKTAPFDMCLVHFTATHNKSALHLKCYP